MDQIISGWEGRETQKYTRKEKKQLLLKPTEFVAIDRETWSDTQREFGMRLDEERAEHARYTMWLIVIFL